MPRIEMDIECSYCKGSGLYQGIAEGNGAAVVCYHCDGTGKFNYSFSYEKFTGRKKIDGIKRVYLSGMGYGIRTGKLNFANGIGEIDMDKEGVSYHDFLSGKMPKHIKHLGCPMIADQGECHKIKGFVDECERLNGGWVGHITSCKHYPLKAECWDRFEREKR